MSTEAAAVEVLRALPAGEWSSVELVEAPGMMSTRTVQADAQWEREGGVPARLKCFIPARAEAGSDTQALVNDDRLNRMNERLSRARKSAPKSLVRLLYVGFPSESGVLVVGMERVTPLSATLEEHRLAAADSAALMRALAHGGCGWIHFDICPANAARTSRGEFVFIDIESFYPVANERYEITMPALKDRLPREFKAQVGTALMPDGTLPNQLAETKHDAEVLLLAAECCLGGGVEWPLAPDGIQNWVEQSGCEADVAAVFSRALGDLVSERTVDLAAVADSLELCASPGALPPATPGGVPPAASPRGETTDESDWADLADKRHALRAERLKGEHLVAYREEVLALARESGDRRYWQEATVIALGYDNDPSVAMQVVQEALVAYPADEGFQRDLRLLQICQGAA